jgi:hypothetical protein
MFRLPPEARWSTTFRLQLFTAAGLRPVAIATQMPSAGEGRSLANAAEECAAVVWRQYCPAEPEPPVWMEVMVTDDESSLPSRGPQLVTFTADRAERTLHGPEWLSVSPADIDALVGRPVDLTRGSGFIAPEIEPDPESTYAARLVAWLPRPTPFREDGCMAAGVPWFVVGRTIHVWVGDDAAADGEQTGPVCQPPGTGVPPEWPRAARSRSSYGKRWS